MARDRPAHPKQQPRQVRPGDPRLAAWGQWRGVGPLPMKPTPPRQGRNIHLNQATRSTATNKPKKEQSTTNSMASVGVRVCVCACVSAIGKW